MTEKNSLPWSYTRTGLIFSFVANAAVLGVFIYILVRNIEFKRTSFIWYSIFCICFWVFNIIQLIRKVKSKRSQFSDVQ